MANAADDVFTEPALDPDTLAHLGPLASMAGVFAGERGIDVHPSAAGAEEARFTERYELQPIDPQTNGPQLLYGLRYHLTVVEQGGEGTFHDQVGYWLYEPATGEILQTVAIPRGQVALARGVAAADARGFTLRAERGTTAFGICSSSFLERAFTTISYEITVTTRDDGTFSYREDTLLQVLGETAPFHHTDENTLRRIEAPRPNPLMRLAAS